MGACLSAFLLLPAAAAGEGLTDMCLRRQWLGAACFYLVPAGSCASPPPTGSRYLPRF